MAEKQLQTAKSGVAPVNVHKQRHIKIRVPIALRIMLPLAATFIIFQGCSGAAQTKQAEKEVNGMGNQELFIKQPNTAQADTLKLTPVKTEGKEKRDSLLKARINELVKESQKYDPTPPERGVPTRPKTGDWGTAIKESDFITFEEALYLSALKGETAKTEKYKLNIIGLGEKYGEQERARKIILNFERIMKME